MTLELQKKYAKKYIDLGWSLLPMQFFPDGAGKMTKVPMVPWKIYQTHPASLAVVEQWLDNGWFLGLITGRASGIVVVDDDRIKHGLSEYGITSSIIAKTKSGGKHYYFKYAEGITNTANESLYLDIRGEGGYVVLPPFNNYTWESVPNKTNLENLAEIPLELGKAIYETEDGKKTTERFELAKAIGMGEGGRDNVMLALARSELNKHRQEEWPNVYIIMQGVNSSFVPPLPEADLQRIFAQAKRYITKDIATGKFKYEEKRQIVVPQQVAERDKIVLYSKLSDEELLKVDKRPRMKTGLPEMDKMFDWPSGYYVICANPGVGKGWFAMWLARKFWQYGKIKTAYFTLEMSEQMIRTRLLQAWSDLSFSAFENGGDTTQAKEMLRKDVMAVYPFGHKDQRYQTPENFSKDFEEIYDHGYRMFVFDHLHELSGMNSNDTNQSVVERWGKAFQEVMKNPKFSDVWLMVYSQPNGFAASKEVITKTDIAGSKSITQKCEFFISLNRKIKFDKQTHMPIADQDERSVFLWIDKNRVSTTQYRGQTIYFSENGNFYESREDEHVVRDVAPRKVVEIDDDESF